MARLVAGLTLGAPPQERYVWSIYDLETGRKRGTLRSGRSGSDFYLHDSLIVYLDDRTTTLGSGRSKHERQPRLVARDVDGKGDVAWTYTVRDTAYRGVRPPRQPAAAERGVR